MTNEAWYTIAIPTSYQMPDILNIVRNEWLDDDTTFEVIASLLEFEPDHPQLALCEVLENLISGNIIDSLIADGSDSGVEGQMAYERALAICDEVAGKLVRGSKYILPLIIRSLSYEFFNDYTTNAAKLLPNGDLCIQYRRRG